jgi:hypothetical protein
MFFVLFSKVNLHQPSWPFPWRDPGQSIISLVGWELIWKAFLAVKWEGHTSLFIVIDQESHDGGNNVQNPKAFRSWGSIRVFVMGH